MNIRVENWQGHKIRFVEQDGKWWAILKDICAALGLQTFKVTQRLDRDMVTKVAINVSDIPSKYVRSRGDNRVRYYTAINEAGIYETLFASRKVEARQFRRWTAGVLEKLRGYIGLQPYEAMRMTEKDIQDDIDHFLDDLFYDQDKGKWMMSVTVQGGDVEQVEFEDQSLVREMYYGSEDDDE
jgi:prophage antirepressor-like protein